MDGELVTNSPPDEKQKGVGEEDSEPTPISYKKLFQDLYPEYLSYGMTYDEYWNGVAELATYYRKAEEIRIQRQNYGYWLQGAYVYEAMRDVAPLYQAFNKHPKPAPYRDEPFPLTAKEAREQEERRNKRKAEEMQAKVLAFAEDFNKKINEEAAQDGEERGCPTD